MSVSAADQSLEPKRTGARGAKRDGWMRVLERRKTLAVLVLPLALFAGGGVAYGSAALSASIQTPSHKVVCNFGSDKVFCQFVAQQHSHRIPTYSVSYHGHARLGYYDQIIEGGPTRTVAYGHTAGVDGVVCTSRPTGLRCVNLQHHGFTMTAGHPRRF